MQVELSWGSSRDSEFLNVLIFTRFQNKSIKKLCFASIFALKSSMQQLLTKYFNYLLIERGVAQNTLESYGRDLRRFIFFVEKSKKITDIKEVTPEVIVEYLTRIREEGLAANSMNRSLGRFERIL